VIGTALRHAFSEAWSITRTAPVQTAIAVGLIGISLFVPGLLFLVTGNVARLVDPGTSAPSLVLTLAEPADARAIAETVAKLPIVERVTIVRPAAARERFGRAFPDLRPALAQIPNLHFPTSIEIVLSASAGPDASEKAAAAARGLPGVEEVSRESEMEARLRTGLSLARRGAAALGGILLLASILSVSSAVRLALDQHRDEIEILRLMGATEGAIRAPFWLQGALEGAAGGLLALGLLLGAYLGASRAVSGGSHPFGAILWAGFLPPAACAAFVLMGSLSGILGAVLAVRREKAN
jgi:cell division transport system permease protein